MPNTGTRGTEVEEGGEGVANPGGPPLSEPHAPENRWLFVHTRPIWRKRGRLGLKGRGQHHAGIFSQMSSFKYMQKSFVGEFPDGSHGVGYVVTCVCVFPCRVCRKLREAMSAEKNAQRAAMRAHFRRKYQLSKVGGGQNYSSNHFTELI